ncbi:hypothetical protein DY000_02023258, partial [Brassica cretica]
RMQNHNDAVKDDEAVKVEEWGNCSVENVQSFQEEAARVPYVGDKEPLSSLAAEYQAGSPILLEKIKILDNQYIAIRRTRGDGNCFFRSFMFSYLEHILESQDGAEVDRIKVNVEKCRKTLQSLGYTDFTFEDFFALFLEQLDDILLGSDESISYEELVYRSRDQSVSDYSLLLLFCKISVEPMGEESDHIHITAFSDALGVAIRVVYLDHSSCDSGGVTVNHHDFVPVGTNEKQEEASAPFITCCIVQAITISSTPSHLVRYKNT